MSTRRIRDCNACHGDISMYCDSLKKSANTFALLEGMCTHDLIIRHAVTSHACLDSLLVQMYVNCERLNDAAAVFMKAHDRSASTWNFLVGAYAAQGDQQKAFKLFQQMQLDKAA